MSDPAVTPRPSIPPVLWAGAGIAAGCAIGSQLVWTGGPGMARRLVLAAGAAAAIAVVGAAASLWAARGRPRLRALALPLVSVALLASGLAWAAATGGGWWARVLAARSQSLSGTATGTLLSDPLPAGRAVGVRVRLLSGPAAGDVVDLMVASIPPGVASGADVSWRGRLVAAETTSAAAALRFAEGVTLAGSCPTITVDGWDGAAGPAWRARSVGMGRMRSARADPGGTALLSLMMLGSRDPTATALAAEPLRTVGLAHIPTSGALQLGLVAFMTAWFARWSAPPRLRRVAASVAPIMAATAYATMAGMRPGVTRGLVAIVAFTVARALGRRGDTLAALGVALAALSLFDPLGMAGIDVWLPTTAVAGVGMISTGLATWLAEGMPRFLRPAARPVAVGMTAQAAALPLSIAAFGIWAPIGPVLGLACIPLAAVGLMTGIVLAPVMALAPRLPAESAVAAAASVCGWCVALASWGAALPGAGSPVAWSLELLAIPLALAAVWAWWPMPRSKGSARVAVGLAALLVLWPLVSVSWAPTGPSVTVLDVGQGDAILLRDGQHAALVDCGPDPAVLRQALARAGVSSLDVVVVTHRHADHYGGLKGLAGSVHVASVVRPEGVNADAASGGDRGAQDGTSEKWGMRFGDVLSVGRVAATALWPQPEEITAETSENDRSVVLVVRYGTHSALLLGDAESEVQDRLVAQGRIPAVDFLKVAHHGSPNGRSDGLLDRARPTLAGISVGAHNTFGHPSVAVVRNLVARGIATYRTDQCGDVTFDLKTGTVSVAHGAAVAVATTAPLTQPLPCATIASRDRTPDRGAWTEDHARRRPLGPQAGLPHLGRGHPARPGRGPPAAPPGVGGRPGLQHGCLRG